MRPDERSTELIISKITEYFHRLGRTSLSKWQINSVVRQHMTGRVSVTHDDISAIEEGILKKETGLPGTNNSP